VKAPTAKDKEVEILIAVLKFALMNALLLITIGLLVWAFATVPHPGG